MSRLVALAVGALGLCALTGCGPLISTYLIVSAQADLDGARAAEAEKFAVYEYTASSAYLQKAREEQGYADFGPSIDFAYKARELAQRAVARSDEEKRKRSTSPAVEWEAPPAEPPASQPRVRIKRPQPSTPSGPGAAAPERGPRRVIDADDARAGGTPGRAGRDGKKGAAPGATEGADAGTDDNTDDNTNDGTDDATDDGTDDDMP